MKPYLAVLVGLFFGLVACTPPATVPEPLATTLPAPSPTPTVLPQPTPVPASDLTTLTLWVPDVLSGETPGEFHPVLLSQIEAFSRDHADIQIQLLMKKSREAGGVYNLLSTTYSAAPAVLPDLVILQHADLREAARNGFVVAFSQEEIAEEVYAFARDAVTIDERAYGLPYLSEMQHAVYATPLGVSESLTWTSILTGGYSLLFPIAPALGLADDFLVGAYQGSGGKVMDADGRASLDRVHLEELYRFMAVMVEAGLVDRERLAALGDARACWELFQQQVATSQTALLSAVPAGLYWSSDERLGVGTAVPTRDGQPFALARVWTLAIVSADPAHEAAAMTLARWLTGRGQVVDLAPSVAMLPTSKDSVALMRLSVDEAVFLDRLLKSAVLPPPEGVDQTVRRALQAGLDYLLTTEGATPEQAATHALTVLRR